MFARPSFAIDLTMIALDRNPPGAPSLEDLLALVAALEAENTALKARRGALPE